MQFGAGQVTGGMSVVSPNQNNKTVITQDVSISNIENFSS